MHVTVLPLYLLTWTKSTARICQMSGIPKSGRRDTGRAVESPFATILRPRGMAVCEEMRIVILGKMEQNHENLSHTFEYL